MCRSRMWVQTAEGSLIGLCLAKDSKVTLKPCLLEVASGKTIQHLAILMA